MSQLKHLEKNYLKKSTAAAVKTKPDELTDFHAFHFLFPLFNV